MYKGSTEKFKFKIDVPIDSIESYTITFQQGSNKWEFNEGSFGVDEYSSNTYTEYDAKHNKFINFIELQLSDKITSQFEAAKQVHIQLNLYVLKEDSEEENSNTPFSENHNIVTKELTTYVYDNLKE